MKIACNYGGWFPVNRGIFKTPVWQDEQAFRVYMSFLAAATHREIIETVGSVSVRLLSGQLTASQSEICVITGYDRNTVRNALAVLKRENAIECGVPRNRQFSVVTVRAFPFSQQGEEESGEDDFSLDSLPTESTKIHQPFDGGNAFDDAGFGIPDGLDDTNRFSENPPTLYRNKEYKELNNKKKEKNILFSSSILSVLSLWRSAKERAGEPYCEDPVTLKGAALMAELWLDTGKASEMVIAGAMSRFLQAVKTTEAAQLYTLKTLANRFGSYLEPPPPVEVVKRYPWTFTCDTCGATSAAFFKETEPPNPHSCRKQVRIGVYCIGTMFPKCDSN